MRERTIFTVTLLAFSMAGWCALADAQNATPPQSNSSTKPNSSAKTQSPDAPKPSTAQDNPFPEDVSRKAADAAKDTSAPDAPAPAAPSAEKQPEGSSSRDGLDKLDLGDSSRKKLKLESPEGGDQPYDPKLAAEDERVGDFYMKSGNYKGAYDRYKEAAAADPGDARAVWGLAESAQKLNMQQEATLNYTAYLDAFPDGAKAKAARKALAELKQRQQ